MQLSTRISGKSQEQAIKHFNDIGEIYLAGKDIKDIENLEELRKDWKGWKYSLTSSQINYAKKTVTHYALSTKKKPVVIQLKEIPQFDGHKLNDVLAMDGGMQFVAALFGISKPTKAKVTSELERISGKDARKICIWSPSASSRKSYPVRALLLYFGVGVFCVNCWGHPDYRDGRVVSRGVIMDSAKRGKSKDRFKEGYNQAINDMVAKLNSMKK